MNCLTPRNILEAENYILLTTFSQITKSYYLSPNKTVQNNTSTDKRENNVRWPTNWNVLNGNKPEGMTLRTKTVCTYKAVPLVWEI